MNREIKFRAWNKREKRMYFWDKEPYLSFFIGDYGDILSNAFKEANAEIFMQYTGLKDKNGKEIYEGDILKSPFEKGLDKCIWFEAETDSEPAMSGFTFTPVKSINGWASYENSWLKVAEVIGNIYENPELLPAEQEKGTQK